MIVSAHQPNLLLAESVTSKLAAADAIVWLDEVQYTKGGYTNRQRTPDGQWITVPVEKHVAFKPINRVRIGDTPGWRNRAVGQILTAWPGRACERVCVELERPYRLLVGLNMAILRVVCDELDLRADWHLQSHLDGGHAVVNISEDREQLRPISERLALMVDELGGSVYLSGPSGRNYLDETPFHNLGIEVRYWHHDGPNPCSLALMTSPMEVAA